MKNKGFTLIELLATIAILGLIMTIAVPNIMSTIDKNKRNTYVEDAKKLLTLAEYKLRSDTSINKPATAKAIVIKLESLDLTEFNEGPEGGSYDTQNSYAVIANTGSSYRYCATLVEQYKEGKRGVSLLTRDELNKESAKNEVIKDTGFTTLPNVGGTIACGGSYSVVSVY